MNFIGVRNEVIFYCMVWESRAEPTTGSFVEILREQFARIAQEAKMAVAEVIQFCPPKLRDILLGPPVPPVPPPVSPVFAEIIVIGEPEEPPMFPERAPNPAGPGPVTPT